TPEPAPNLESEDDDSMMSADDIASLVAQSTAEPAPSPEPDDDDDDSIMSADDIAALVAQSQSAPPEQELVEARQMDVLSSQEDSNDDSILSQDDIQSLLSDSGIDQDKDDSVLDDSEISALFNETPVDSQKDAVSELFNPDPGQTDSSSEVMSNEDIAKMFEPNTPSSVSPSPPQQTAVQEERQDELNADEMAAMLREANEAPEAMASPALSEDKSVDSEIQANRQAQLDALLSTTTNLTEAFQDSEPKSIPVGAVDESNQQFTPPMMKRKKSKPWFKFLAAAVILLVSLGGGYGIHQYIQNMKEKTPSSEIKWVIQSQKESNNSSLKATFRLGENKPWGAISIFNATISRTSASNSIKKHYSNDLVLQKSSTSDETRK
ncbi:hypothetical protein MJH12_12485, partial [bacterium]|nr:hypothetical protein [bacterium]